MSTEKKQYYYYEVKSELHDGTLAKGLVYAISYQAAEQMVKKEHDITELSSEYVMVYQTLGLD